MWLESDIGRVEVIGLGNNTTHELCDEVLLLELICLLYCLCSVCQACTEDMGSLMHQPPLSLFLCTLQAGKGGERGGPRDRFVLSAVISPDGSTLAASAMDGSVAVFNASTGQLMASLKGHNKPVRTLAFTPGK
jgi:WD40 repeat protein